MSKMEVKDKCAHHSLNNVNIDKPNDMYPSVQRSLKQITSKEGYKKYKMIQRLISTEGGNYLGDLYEVDIKGETTDGIKETNIFVKHTIPGESAKDLISINSAYRNEIFLYTELSKIYDNFQDEAGIPCSERFKMVKSFDGRNEDAIFLENLTKKGYKTPYRMDAMPLNYAELTIKQLAKFHGLSFVLKHKNRDYYDRNIKTVQTPRQFGKPWKDYTKRIADDILHHCDSNIQNKLRNYSDIICEKLPKYFNGDTATVRCLSHGDLRMNNILVKENGNKLEEVIIIDYQLMCYGSPVIDLMHFLYTGSDKQFRKDHISYLKLLYHDTLRDYLKFFDLNVDHFYSKKLFLDDFEAYHDAGLMVAFCVLPFCLTGEEGIPDLSKVTIQNMKFKLDERFNRRFRDIAEDLVHTCL